MDLVRRAGLSPLLTASLSPVRCAQMTGRKGRVVCRPDGSVMFESRAEQGLSIDHVNLKEKERFMKGEKVSQVRAKETSEHLHGGDERGRKGRVFCVLVPYWPQANKALQLSVCLFDLLEGDKESGSLRGLGPLLCFGLFLEAVLQMSGNLTLLSHLLSLSLSL